MSQQKQFPMTYAANLLGFEALRGKLARNQESEPQERTNGRGNSVFGWRI